MPAGKTASVVTIPMKPVDEVENNTDYAGGVDKKTGYRTSRWFLAYVASEDGARIKARHYQRR